MRGSRIIALVALALSLASATPIACLVVLVSLFFERQQPLTRRIVTLAYGPLSTRQAFVHPVRSASLG